MIGIHARDLRKGDRIIGMGVVASATRDSDGDIFVQFEPVDTKGYHIDHGARWFDINAWLRIEREGAE